LRHARLHICVKATNLHSASTPPDILPLYMCTYTTNKLLEPNTATLTSRLETERSKPLMKQ